MNVQNTMICTVQLYYLFSTEFNLHSTFIVLAQYNNLICTVQLYYLYYTIIVLAQILYNKLGMENKKMVFLFTDQHVVEEGELTGYQSTSNYLIITMMIVAISVTKI